MTCPRILSRDEIIARLQAGGTLVVVRKDAPELQDLLELERHGLVKQQFVEIDEQSRVLKIEWRWA